MKKNTENEFYSKVIDDIVQKYFRLQQRRKLVVLQNGDLKNLEMVEKKLVDGAKLEEKVVLIGLDGLQDYRRKDGELVIAKYPQGLLDLRGKLREEAYQVDFNGLIGSYSRMPLPKSCGSPQRASDQGSQPSGDHPFQQKKPY